MGCILHLASSVAIELTVAGNGSRISHAARFCRRDVHGHLLSCTSGKVVSSEGRDKPASTLRLFALRLSFFLPDRDTYVTLTLSVKGPGD